MNPSLHNLNFKIFVKELGDNYVDETTPKRKLMPVVPLTGETAKKIYEEIVSEPPKAKPISPLRRSKRIPKPKPKPIVTFKQSDIFKLAQNNKAEDLKLLLSQPGIQINATDNYGWTALMCAACSGAKDAVLTLLEKNADISIYDKSNNTAISLARKNHQDEILAILKNYKKLQKEKSKPKKQCDPIFCEICKQEFKMEIEKHECSTLHLFNSKLGKLKTFYGIPDSNRGFQLLLKEGWDREQGLGPEGSGRKFPVKATMKKDRSGIGAPPREKRERKCNTQIYENKKIRLLENRKKQSFERNFRLEFL